MFRRALLSGLALWLVMIAGPLTASAYILPTDFLLKLLAERRRVLRLRDVAAEVVIERDDERVDGRLYLRGPERRRLVEEEEGGWVWVEREGVRAAGRGNDLERAQDKPTDLLALLLMPAGKNLESRAERQLSVLSTLGVDVARVSLSRYEGRPAYVVGALPWEDTRPQVWLDKETTLPVRSILYTRGGQVGDRIDTHYLDWGSGAAGNWLPRVIESYAGDRLRLRVEVQGVKVNQNLPQTLFDIP